ncbi:MAG: cyclic nucleotide-binding domain-containing protein [Synechococcales cyanobacterium C42_A2020_086]|jgi:CRP-like cAMP-binding protein|nr:cyclic nucleotide-binding domain-containing protein [Synechococcales cyanobacterium M58_A2018_015]MBF2072188.1 cyclic nucleotide-binding domain-containing protein [Synechococcales cyanobacterium C42_A2020_086]
MAPYTQLEPARTVSIFQRQPDCKTVAAGEIIFKAGDPGDCMYGLIEGEVEELVDDQVLETIKAGDVFGVGALVHPDGTRVSTARAKTDCTLAFLDQERFLFAIQETPMFALNVIRSYSDRLKKFKKHPLDKTTG